jgi:hypothetical protein
MDVSKDLRKVSGLEEGSPETKSEGKGNSSELLSEVASLTGLPVDWVHSELTQIVEKSGHAPAELTLDELRASMLAYLEEMNKEMNAQEQADLDFLESLAVPSDIAH